MLKSALKNFTAGKTWQIYTLCTLICFTLWAFSIKIAYKAGMSRNLVILFGVLAQVILTVYLNQKTTLEIVMSQSKFGIVVAMISGCLSNLGNQFQQRAIELNNSDSSIIVAFSALYPAFNMLLCVIFMGEVVTINKILGFICALFSAWFFMQ